MAAEDTPNAPGAASAALEGAHAGTAPAENGGGGLPQFELQYWGGQIVWLLLIFIVLYTLMSRVFIPRLRRVKDTRAETIASAVAEARRVQDEADAQASAARAEIEQACPRSWCGGTRRTIPPSTSSSATDPSAAADSRGTAADRLLVARCNA